MSAKAGEKAKDYLEKMGVIIKLNTRVVSYDGKELFCNDNTSIISSTVIWSAGVKGDLIPGISGE